MKTSKSRKTQVRTKGVVRKGAKKGGGGGRFTYGAPGDELYASSAVEEGDPTYDPYEDGGYEDYAPPTESDLAARVGIAVDRSRERVGAGVPDDAAEGALTLQEYKGKIAPIIREFFVNEDLDELAFSVQQLDTEVYNYELCKRAITMSLDQGDREKELVSRMMSELYSRMLTSDHIGKAFERLFELMDDLELDVPDAKSTVANFLARAVVDEILPPAFLSDSLIEGIGGSVVEQAKVLLSMRRSGARLEHVWSLGANAPIEDLKKSVALLIKEFLLSEDLLEAARCVRELDVPHFGHEVVKRGMVVAIDRDSRSCELISTLFTFLHAQDVVQSTQMKNGFVRVRDELTDITLDDPSAPALFRGFVERAVADGILDADFSPEPVKDSAGAGAASSAE